MLPMERSRIFEILTEIFSKLAYKNLLPSHCIIMKECAALPHDINFKKQGGIGEYPCAETVGYLRIVNPPEDCIDGEYCLVYHSCISEKDANIGIMPNGTTRVYGDNVSDSSFIFDTIAKNANEFGEYAKELTCQEHNQVVDEVIYHVDKFLDMMMNKYASVFDQKTSWVSEYGVTCIKLMCLNHPEKNIEVNIVKHIGTENVMTNDIWIRFHFNDQTCFIPIILCPWKGILSIEVNPVPYRLAFARTTEEFTVDAYIALAWKLGKQLGYTVVSTNEYVQSRIAKYQTKVWLEQDNSDELPDEPDTGKKIYLDIKIDFKKRKIFDMVCAWFKRRKDQEILPITFFSVTGNKLYLQYPIDTCPKVHGVTITVDVVDRPFTKDYVVWVNTLPIIKVLGIVTRDVVSVKFPPPSNMLFKLLQKYDILCLAEAIKDKLELKELQLMTTDDEFETLVHTGQAFFTDSNPRVAVAFDHRCTISNENINENASDLDPKASTDDLVDEKLQEFIKSGSLVYTTKDYLCAKICEKLTPWQQGVFHEIYSAIYCTLAESKYVGSALELERHFMELVATDKDGEGFHVYFRLNNIHEDLPKFDIAFFDKDNTYIRMQENEWTKPCALIKRGDEIKIYKTAIRYMKDTYKAIVSHVVSKVVLLEGLS